MLCKIAELITEVPTAGDLVPRCVDYRIHEERSADITIRTELFGPNVKGLPENDFIYIKLYS